MQDLSNVILTSDLTTPLELHTVHTFMNNRYYDRCYKELTKMLPEALCTEYIYK